MSLTVEQLVLLIGAFVGLIGGLSGLYVSLRRSGSQNRVDDTGAMKALQETSDLATVARLAAERERDRIMKEYGDKEHKMEQEISALRDQLKNSTFEMVITIKNLAAPEISDLRIRRISQSGVATKA